MSTLWALDVLREGVGLLFNASLHCHWEPGQVAACELHALYGTDTTLPSLKTCNEDCTRPDMKSRWDTFKHLMNFGVLSCLFIPGFQALSAWCMWKFQWKEWELQCRQIFNIIQKRSHTQSLCTQRLVSTTLKAKHIFYLNDLCFVWTHALEAGTTLLNL